LIPILLALMGVFDLGRGVFYLHMLSNAVREGARVGIAPARTADEICAQVFAATRLPDVPRISRCGTSGALAVSVPQRGTPGAVTDPLRVLATYSFKPVTPLVRPIAGDAITLSASSTMYVEG
jgi:hypothetical protein